MACTSAHLAAASALLLTTGVARAAVDPGDIVCWKPTVPKAAGYWTAALQASAVVNLRPRPPAGQATIADLPPTLPTTDPPHANPVGQADLAKAPYAFIGQAFFDQGGNPLKGTAEFMARDVLLTAAHNLSGVGGTATDLTFIRTAPSADAYTAVYGGYLKWWTDATADVPTYGPDGSDYALVVVDRGFDGGKRPRPIRPRSRAARLTPVES